jgi:hypothetical protein
MPQDGSSNIDLSQSMPPPPIGFKGVDVKQLSGNGNGGGNKNTTASLPAPPVNTPTGAGNAANTTINADNSIENLRNVVNTQVQQFPNIVHGYTEAIDARVPALKNADDALLGAVMGARQQSTQASQGMMDALANIQKIDRYPEGIGRLLGMFPGMEDWNRRIQADKLQAGQVLLDDAKRKVQDAATLHQIAIEEANRPVETAQAKVAAGKEIMTTAESGISANISAQAGIQQANLNRVSNASNDLLKQWATMDNPPVPKGLAQQELTRRDTASVSLQSANLSLKAGQLQLYDKHLSNWLQNANPTDLANMAKIAAASPDGSAPVKDPNTGEVFGKVPLRVINTAIYNYQQSIRTQSMELAKQAEARATIDSSQDKVASMAQGIIKLNDGTMPQDFAILGAREAAKVQASKIGGVDAQAQAEVERADNLTKWFQDSMKNDPAGMKAAKEHFVQNGGFFTDNLNTANWLVSQARNPQMLAGSVYENVGQQLTDNLNQSFLASGRLAGSQVGQGKKLTPEQEALNSFNMTSFYDLVAAGKVDSSQYLSRAAQMSFKDAQGNTTNLAQQTQLAAFRDYVNTTVRGLVTDPNGRPLDSSPYRKYVDNNGNLLDKYKYNFNQLARDIASDEQVRNTGPVPVNENDLMSTHFISMLRSPSVSSNWSKQHMARLNTTEAALVKAFMDNKPERFFGGYINQMAKEVANGREAGKIVTDKNEQMRRAVVPMPGPVSGEMGTIGPIMYQGLIDAYKALTSPNAANAKPQGR